MKKRILSVLMVLCLVLTVIPTALAEGEEDPPETPVEETDGTTSGNTSSGGNIPASESNETVPLEEQNGGIALQSSTVETENSLYQVGDLYYDTWSEAYDVAVSSGDTLYFLADIQSFYQVISDTITVDLNNHSISAASGCPVFYIQNGGNLTLTGEGVLNGSNYGNGVLQIVNGTLTMTGNVTLQGNTSSSGGGVYVASGCTFTMNGGTIQDTSASYGGGVYNSGTFTMNGGTIQNTKSTREYSYSTVYGGGGVYVASSGIFGMSGGAIQGASANAHGGGVLNAGTFTMSGGEISGNEVTRYGGGVYNSGAFTMSAGSIRDNNAISGSGSYQNGGGVLNEGAFTMSGGAVTGNRGNGGIYSVDNASFLTISGGAVYNNPINADVGTIDIVYGDKNSQAGQVSVIAASEMEAEGYTFGSWIFYSNSLTAEPVETDGALPAEGHTSGWRYFYKAEIVSEPGTDPSEEADGIYLDGINGDDTNNGTSTETAVKTFEKAKTLAESQINNDVESVTIYVCDTVTVSGTENNWTLPDGVILQRAAGYSGYLVEVPSGASLTLTDITIDGNRQPYVYTDSLICVKGTLNITNGTTLQNNLAGREYDSEFNYNGGAVYADDKGAVVTMSGGTIKNCASSYLGGGITVALGKFNMTGGTITSNESQYGGGVALVRGAQMTFSGGTISNNAANQGGGINVGGPDTATANDYGTQMLTMTGGTIDGNTANSAGGGIYIQQNSEADIREGSITGNMVTGTGDTRPWRGGGIYVNGERSNGFENGILRLTNVEIADNQSSSDGGGLAGCNTSDIEVYLTNGGILHDNLSYYRDNSAVHTASEVYIYYDIYSGGHEVYISDFMLGGGMYEWYDLNGERVYSGILDRESTIYLNNAVARTDIENARKLAKVFITGNTANGGYGGGIATNGHVIIGDEPQEEEYSAEITVTKNWDPGKYTDAAEQANRPASISANIQYGGYLLRGIELTAENDWKVTIPNLPNEILEQEDPSVSVEELDCAGYNVDETSVTAEIDQETGALNIHFTNVYDPTIGNLTVSKTVSGSGASSTKEFTFTVTLDAPTINGTYGGMTFVNGVATFTLSDGESVTATGLPKDVAFTVEESDNSGYTVSATLNRTAVSGDAVDGTIPAGDTAEVAYNNYQGSTGGTTTPDPDPDDKDDDDPEPTPTPTPTPNPDIPATPDNPDTPDTPNQPDTPSEPVSPSDPGVPQTSDTSLTGLWLALCLLALGGLGLLRFTQPRRGGRRARR